MRHNLGIIPTVLELCRVSLPTRPLPMHPLSWCIGVGYTCILPAGDAVLSAIVSVTWQPLVIGVLEAWFFSSATGIDRPIVPDF